MKSRLILALCFAGFLSACNSTNGTVNTAGEASVSKSPVYQKLKIPNMEDATVSDVIYFAAKQADSISYKKFALVQEHEKDVIGVFRQSKIAVFMFNAMEDLKQLERYNKKSRPVSVIGVFETDEYKDKRFVPVGQVPGTE